MKVTVHTFGFLIARDQNRKDFELDMKDGSRLRDVVDALGLGEKKKYAVFIDRKRQKDPDKLLGDGDVIEIFSIVGGG